MHRNNFLIHQMIFKKFDCILNSNLLRSVHETANKHLNDSKIVKNSVSSPSPVPDKNKTMIPDDNVQSKLTSSLATDEKVTPEQVENFVFRSIGKVIDGIKFTWNSNEIKLLKLFGIKAINLTRNVFKGNIQPVVQSTVDDIQKKINEAKKNK